MSIKTIKRKLGLIVQHNRLLRGIATDINFALFHWDGREQARKFGPLNPSVRFYVIRSSGMDEGLLSLYLGRLVQINALLKNGFIPIVDYEHYRTQYNVDFPVNGTRNAWEYYFEQPCSFSLGEVYHSRNVMLSGWKFFQAYSAPKLERNVTQEMLKNAPVKQYVYDIARKRIIEDGINEMIGLLVRGTDYTRIRPAGHSVSPAPEQVSQKLDEFLERYGERRVFLATEDGNIYKFFRERYGDLIYTTDENLIYNYSGRDYIANEISAENKYKFGLDYLVKMICLSECKYLVAAKTAGTEFAVLLNGSRYQDKHIFELGSYHLGGGVYVVYSRFLDESGALCIGGVEKYISDLGDIFTEAGLKFTVCQYSDEDFDVNYRGFTVKGVKGAKSPGDILDFIETCGPDYDNDILIFATDFMITHNKFRHSIAIQHGVAWDTASYMQAGIAGNYAAMMKNFLRAIKKFNRYRHCREIVCVDYNFINWYRTQVKGIDINIHCIPNYAEVPEAQRSRDGKNISVVFSRRLVEYRGTRLFADTMGKILGRHPDVKVTVAGKGPDEQYMRGKLGKFPNVEFTSYDAKDSIEFHSRHDIAVVPTVNHEGTSLALLEAMASGCAVIASNVGGMSNIIIDGYNGLLINPLQSELEDAVELLIGDAGLRRTLAAKGYETVKEGFSFGKWREKWLKLIADIRKR
ncbi:MAG: glycosyltransferase [Synergistaceae bacterium]|nr:glycosyltransferase [Synergistaceae bacterium]